MNMLQLLPKGLLSNVPFIVLISKIEDLSDLLFLEKEEILFLKNQLNKKMSVAELISPQKSVVVIAPIEKKTISEKNELYRRAGSKLLSRLESLKIESIQIIQKNISGNEQLVAFVEGLVLTNYKFTKYKSSEKTILQTIYLDSESITNAALIEWNSILEAIYLTRDLVNEPVIYLTAEQLSVEIEKLGKASGFQTEIFNKSKIQSLKMGGLLAVNEGSPNPPTFNVLEYRPSNAINKSPIVLVGKGVVYDTGGLSLKPTEHSMDMMKCDMAGAAAVVGTFYAVAKNKLPLYVIGLIPATENRPDGNAITPGDIITMHNGKTVEILNTDAEGRLILADALSYAQKYNPELVIDLATLTGSAVRAVGKEAIVYMGTADDEIKKSFEHSSIEVFERLVEFPLWEDYNEHIQSDIADLKNIGTSEAGAISAGKFLEHFTNYPWLHLDIAGGAFMTSPFHYWVKGGTGIGVRLLYHFLKNKVL